MTVNLKHPTKSFVKLVSRTLLLALLVAGLSATSALAQDDQEYKRAFNAGLEAYKAENITEARSQWAKAAQLAQSAGDSEIAKKSNYYVAQIDYKLGLQAFKAENFEKALEHFKAGTERYPDYAKNLYGQGLALNKLNRTDEALAAYQQVMESNDRKTARTAEERIREHFYFQASSAVSKQGATRSDADRAMSALEASTEYLEPDADYYYYMAVAHNIKGNYDQAVTNADKALDMHRGSATDKAKIYYAKGEALMYAGNTEAAKAAFQNATYGSYAASARHYLETL